MAITLLTNRWAQARLPMKAAIVISAVPVGVWGVCAAESAIRCVLGALHTMVSLNAKSRNDRWAWVCIHALNTKATALSTLASCIPIIGTYKSYQAMLKMIDNHVSNTWSLRELQQRTNAHAADSLYEELVSSWEPNLEKLLQYTQDAKPTQREVDETADELKASLVGRSWAYSLVFHTIDGSCRAINVIALRIIRIISARYLFRLIARLYTKCVYGLNVIKNAAAKEIQHVCDLVDYPVRKPPQPVPEMYFDAAYLILDQCNNPVDRERVRYWFTKTSTFRPHMTSNALTRVPADLPLPGEAQNDYYHMLRELPKAFAIYAEKGQGYILPYFATLFPHLDHFKNEWLINMPPEASRDLLWALSTRLPNLRTLSLDLNGIDPRWQILIAFQLCRHSRSLQDVTLTNAHERTREIMRRFTPWGCVIH